MGKMPSALATLYMLSGIVLMSYGCTCALFNLSEIKIANFMGGLILSVLLIVLGWWGLLQDHYEDEDNKDD